MEQYFLYRHIRLDTNEPFYVGIGTVNYKYYSHCKMYQRAYTKNGRNTFWHNIINKTNYDVEIIIESKDKKFILEKEIEFIELYGRKDLKSGSLVNHTNGGERNLGMIVSDKRKNELRNSWSGHNNPCYNKKGKDHPAYGKGGFKGKHTPEALEKIAEHSRGWNHPGCKLNKEQVIEIHEAWNSRPKNITKKDFCKTFELKFNVKFRVIYNALNYKL